MKNILVTLLFVFSSFIFSQSYFGSNAKSNDVDKVLTWLQYIAIIEEGVAIEYDSASLRNNVIEINGLKISEFVFPDNLNENIVSFGDLVSQGSQSYATGTFTVKKIKINLKWIEDLLNLSKTGDKKLLANMYKTQSYFEIQELKFPTEFVLDEIIDELSYTEASVASRAANYLNNMSMKVEVKAKGKLRADAIMTVDLNDELSLLYSGESSIDGDSLGYQYFSMLEKIVSPLDEIVRNLEVFISITSDDCPDLYKKDNLNAWFAYDNDEYCGSADRFLNELDLESEFDDLDDLVSDNELFLMSNPMGSKIYGFKVNLNWSDRVLRDASILSGGVIDTALLTIKGIFDTKLNKQEFNQLLYQFSGPEFGEIISSVLQGDDVYREYSKYQPRIKSFANNPQGIGLSFKSRSGIDQEYLLYISENPLLITSLLDDAEFELLFNKRN
mgnify:FL=1|jgi:hypothetical protein|tara:strand:+ start:124 stop:1455 length:1332 start_codon:yes stop_codon:yes gene_type:complete